MTKMLLAAASLSILAASFAAPTAASAKPLFFPGFIGKPGPKFGAGLVGGLVLGAIAARAAAGPDCYLTRRVYVDDAGYEYARDVQVCD